MFYFMLLFPHNNSYVKLPVGIRQRQTEAPFPLLVSSKVLLDLGVMVAFWMYAPQGEVLTIWKFCWGFTGFFIYSPPDQMRDDITPSNKWGNCHYHKAHPGKCRRESEGKTSTHIPILYMTLSPPQNSHLTNLIPGPWSPELFLETHCPNMTPFIASNQE